MKKLEKEFSNRSFIYKQLERINIAAIYEVWLKDKNVLCRINYDKSGDILIGYEVIKIRKRKAFEIYDRKYPHSEVYPGKEQWGMYGWTYNKLGDAREKYAELV